MAPMVERHAVGVVDFQRQPNDFFGKFSVPEHGRYRDNAGSSSPAHLGRGNTSRARLRQRFAMLLNEPVPAGEGKQTVNRHAPR